MSVENISPIEQQPYKFGVIDGGLADDGSDEAPTIFVDGTWYTEPEFLAVLGVGEGYSRYADRRPVDVSWLLMGGKNHIQTPEDAAHLVEGCYDLEGYAQPDLQNYLETEEYARSKLRLELPEGA